MLDKNRVDLSSLKTQSILVITFNEFFSLEELEQIDISKIVCSADDNATKPCNGMTYDIGFDNSSFSIKCVLNIESIPAVHHTKLIFDKDGIYNISVECNPNDMNPYYMMEIIAKSINFAKYHAKGDIRYNRYNIIDNASLRTTKVIPDYNTITYIRDGIAKDLYQSGYYKDLSEPFVVEKDGCKCVISKCYNKLLKVELYGKEIMDYAYFQKTELGLNIASLTLDKAIVKLKSDQFKILNDE